MTTARDLAKFIMEALRENDYKRVSKAWMKKHWGKNIVGLWDYNDHNIYVVKDLPPGYFDNVFLHELSHVYHGNIGQMDASEDVVQALADKWHRIVYGLEERLEEPQK